MTVRKHIRYDGGKATESSRHYAFFADHRGMQRKMPLFKDRKASVSAADTIRRMMELRAGGDTLPRELSRWIEETTPFIRGKLMEFGIIDGAKHAASKPLTGHLEDYRSYLQARGRNERYIKLTIGQLERALLGCGWRVWGDIAASGLDKWLNDLRSNTDSGASDRTANSYLIAAKSFCNWMVKDGRALASPLKHLGEREEAQTKRGPFTKEEAAKLIRAAASGPAWRGISGEDRALVYRLAIETGLRANELRLLTKAAFLFGDRPAVVAEKMTTKGKKQRTIGLRSDTAAIIAERLAHKLPLALALIVPDSDETSLMIYADMERAAIERVDANGRKRDFHSLRSTTASFFNSAGVNPKVAQAVLGHSDINLTLGIYTHTYRDDEAQAVAALPSLPSPTAAACCSEAVAATGTDGKALDTPRAYVNNPTSVSVSASVSVDGGFGRILPNVGELEHVATAGIESIASAGESAVLREDSGLDAQRLGNGVTVAQQTLDRVCRSPKCLSFQQVANSHSGTVSASVSVALEKYPDLIDLIRRWPALSTTQQSEIMALAKGGQE